MSRSMTLNVRISNELSDHVAENIGEYGLYENVSEYVRDLIRHDRQRVEAERFAALKAELQRAVSTADGDYVALSAADVISRNANAD